MSQRSVNLFLYHDDPVSGLRLFGSQPGDRPELWQGNATDFRVLVVDAQGAVESVADFASMTFELRDSQEETTPILTKTVLAAAFGSPTSQGEFTTGASEHASFAFTDVEMDIPTLGSPNRLVWLSVQAELVGGGTRTLAVGLGRINIA